MNVEKKKELYSLHSLLGFLAMGKTGGNPPVSAVLTNEKGEIIEKAHTQTFGGNHAERELFSLLAKKQDTNPKKQSEKTNFELSKIKTNQSASETESLLSESILSVSLEPCTHFGKTPPCRDLVLTQKPKELLIGWKDPNPLVLSGDWTSYKEKGISVRLDPVLANASLPYLQGFIKRIQSGKPWVWIKSATSKEGHFADVTLKKERVSSESVDLYLQMLRAKFDAVAVGPNTLQIDEPSLHFRITEPMIQKMGNAKRITDLVPFFEASTNLISALCQWTTESFVLHELEEAKYQPYRVFVVDPNRIPSANFFAKQKKLNDDYGEKRCIFFLLEKESDRMEGKLGISETIQKELESLSNHKLVSLGKEDGDTFLKSLGEIGINTLICEAGSFFPHFLESSLTEEDCILEIRNSEKSIPHGIPFAYREEPIVSEFRIGSDFIFIRKPKRRT